MFMSFTKIKDDLKQQSRVGVFIANTVLAVLLYFVITGVISPFNSAQGLWLLAAIAYWLLTLVTTPFFTPPKDTLANSISTISMLAPVSFVTAISFKGLVESLYWAAILLSLITIIFALISIFKRAKGDQSLLATASYQLSSKLGRGDILFTLVILVSALGFYQDKIEYALLIMGFWLLMVVVKPVELAIKVYEILNKETSSEKKQSSGSVLRIDDPNIVKVNLANASTSWGKEDLYSTVLSNGRKAYILPLFTQVQNESVIGTGLLSESEEEASSKDIVGNIFESKNDGVLKELISDLVGGDETKGIAGLITENSSIGNIKFQVVKGLNLKEGMVVFCKVQNQKVYYQILDAKTDEETFQSQPQGVHIVSASQLGSFDKDKGFQKFSWLPDMNQPVFLVSKDDTIEQNTKDGEFVIGKVPSTGFDVSVELNSLIEYHAAILGITGTGKTELALDIIKNAIGEDTKVFCVDFTGEYEPRLKDFNPQIISLKEERVKELEKALFAVETGEYGAPKEKAALQDFLKTIQPEVEEQIDNFLMDEDANLGVFELSEINNTKATLKTTEMYLSTIMNWARKHRKARKIMIVLEEAHTIIPEAYGAGFDKDTQWVVGRIGQIALQGRKYGVGLLLLSQRTALVSKTILSQCNTYFTHGLVDKTSLDYLGGVYSPEHVSAIPNLRAREFLATGKAVKSEQPLLVKVPFDQKKLDASKALDTTYEEVKNSRAEEEIVEEVEDVPEEVNPDDIPF